MSDELPPETPEVPVENPPVIPTFIDRIKRTTMERIVSHLNGVGSTIVNAYPMAEVESWPIQKLEAEAAVAIGEEAFRALSVSEILKVTPFILSVTEVHFPGVEDESVRAAQVWDKVTAVKANADLWATLSAYVNGLRARTQDRIDAATSETEVYTIESQTATELETFRRNAGI